MVVPVAAQPLSTLVPAASWETSRSEILAARRAGRPVRTAIVGAGIAGLETARELMICGVRDVTIYYDRDSIVSLAAAGVVEPIAGAKDAAGAALEAQLFARSMPAWSEMCRREPHLVSTRTVDNYSGTSRPEPSWAEDVYDFRQLDPSELHPAYRDGEAARFSTFVIETPRYLSSLRNRLAMRGVRFRRRHIVDLKEITGVEAIVNASGLGAASLAGDQTMYRGDGHLIYVTPTPGVDRVFMDESRAARAVAADAFRVNMLYIIPRKYDIAIGGTFWESADAAGAPDPLPGIANHLRSLAAAIEPSLAHARILSYRVASRPCRPGGVRVELDVDGDIPIVHCYGQGGSGWTIAPALAETVVGLLAPAVWGSAQSI